MRIRKNVPLAPLTTLEVGGSAAYFSEPTNERSLEKVLAWARDKNLRVLILGEGSNIVVSDTGFDGLVVRPVLKGISGEERGTRALLTAAAGEPWDDVVSYAVQHGWAGIENLSGIPSSTGGTVVQNINAYGQTLADSVREVHVVEVATGEHVVFNKAACKFSYRDSFFKHEAVGRYVITIVVLQLSVGSPVSTGYQSMHGSLSSELEGKELTLDNVRKAVLRVRGRKGHLRQSGTEMFRSVGSFFTNPIVPSDVFNRVRAEATKLDAKKEERLRPWFWEHDKTGMPDNMIKISAGFLMEFTEFTKGYRRGNVGISPKHTLALVTYPGATAYEFVELARDIQETVKKKFGVLLEPEAQLVGFDPYPLLKK